MNQDITADQLAAHPALQALLAQTADAAIRAYDAQVNPVNPADRPGGAGIEGMAGGVSNVNLHRAHRASLTRAVRAVRRGSWKGAELERDLAQATAAIFGGPETDDDSFRSGFSFPLGAASYVHLMEEAGIRTDPQITPAIRDAAVRAFAEGTPSLTVSGAGVLTPIQYATDKFAMALTSSVALRNMPEVDTFPASGPVVELPRESVAATAAALAENATITATDPTFAMQEFPLRKQGSLKLISNESLKDAGPALDSYVSKSLARDIALLQDSQYLEGSGAGVNVRGIRNYTGLTTSSWTAAANGSTPTADDLVKMVYDIYKANARMSAWIMHPRTLQNIALLKDANGRYIFTDMATWGGPQTLVTVDGFTYPSASVGKLLGFPVYMSTQILINETQGASNVATHILYGDFRSALIIDRLAIDIFASEHFAMNADQTAVRAVARSTVGLLQPLAFAAATGII